MLAEHSLPARRKPSPWMSKSTWENGYRNREQWPSSYQVPLFSSTDWKQSPFATSCGPIRGTFAASNCQVIINIYSTGVKTGHLPYRSLSDKPFRYLFLQSYNPKGPHIWNSGQWCLLPTQQDKLEVKLKRKCRLPLFPLLCASCSQPPCFTQTPNALQSCPSLCVWGR